MTNKSEKSPEFDLAREQEAERKMREGENKARRLEKRVAMEKARACIREHFPEASFIILPHRTAVCVDDVRALHRFLIEEENPAEYEEALLTVLLKCDNRYMPRHERDHMLAILQLLSALSKNRYIPEGEEG